MIDTTPHYATPHHATPRHTPPHHTTPQQPHHTTPQQPHHTTLHHHTTPTTPHQQHHTNTNHTNHTTPHHTNHTSTTLTTPNLLDTAHRHLESTTNTWTQQSKRACVRRPITNKRHPISPASSCVIEIVVLCFGVVLYCIT